MSKLLERNKKVIEKVILNGKAFREADGTVHAGKEYRDEFKARWGVDPYDPAMLKEGFSWQKAAAKMAKFREAEMSQAWVQLLRAGVQNIANNMYQTLETSHEKWVSVVPSSKNTELYAPLQSVSFPNEVAEAGLFPEVSTAGLSIQLQNRKYGSLFAISNEAMEDDQTGQLVQRAQMMGEYLKILTEVLIMGKFLSPSGGVTYLNFQVPVSETSPSIPATESAYPWSTAMTGGGANRPASYSLITQASLTAGLQAMMTQKDLLGNYLAVRPSHILHSPKRHYDVALLLNSAYYPSGAAAAGNTGGAFAINPMKGVVDALQTPWMPRSTGVIDGQCETWFLVDASKPAFILQLREGVSVVSEAPNSGEGFNRQIQRYRASVRMNADFIDPRFYYLGNDGSVTS